MNHCSNLQKILEKDKLNIRSKRRHTCFYSLEVQPACGDVIVVGEDGKLLISDGHTNVKEEICGITNKTDNYSIRVLLH